MSKKSEATTTATVNPISGVRFRKREIDDILRNTELGEGHAKIGQDTKGFYVEDPGPVVNPVDVVVRRLLARLREGRGGGQVQVPMPRAKPTPSGIPASPPGACAMVREWAEQNPNATVKEAIDHFPEVNAVTVRIQVGKVRKGA